MSTILSNTGQNLKFLDGKIKMAPKMASVDTKNTIIDIQRDLTEMEYQTEVVHLKSGLVPYWDPHCKVMTSFMTDLILFPFLVASTTNSLLRLKRKEHMYLSYT